ncbi:MAG: hypothetical protein KJ718_05055 [Nanoarchaeota archaeon]|nr:hypothetical protein [Nanoarchaeota archaeon]MBU1051894.1 hypothetical protein [Nanoarchaeota archaeon]MBU1988937.1 hypothetical protein [Nanoarchaeota archaeon]
MKTVIKEVRRFEEGNFFMKTVPKKRFEYVPGQFVMVKLGEVEKPFSIAVHDEIGTIDFLISAHPDGEITPKLEKMKPGDKFEIEGPYGAFTVRETKSKEIVFIAAGTGIAPFRGMILEALKRFPEKKITLIFGFRYDFYFEKFWKSLEKKYKNFRVYASCSSLEKKWIGLRGRVTEHLEKKIKSTNGKEVYVCGSPAMVKSTKKVLKKIGFKDKQIRTEKW